jgi:hypothetical protein
VLSPVVFGFYAERVFADGLNKRIVVFCDDDNSEVCDCVTFAIFFRIESDDGAARNQHVAIDDRAA